MRMAYVTNRLEAFARFLRVAVARRTVETAQPAKVEGSTAEELSLGRRHAAILTFAEHHELYVWSHNERHTFVNDFWETRQCNAMRPATHPFRVPRWCQHDSSLNHKLTRPHARTHADGVCARHSVAALVQVRAVQLHTRPHPHAAPPRWLRVLGAEGPVGRSDGSHPTVCSVRPRCRLREPAAPQCGCEGRHACNACSC